MEVWCTQGGGPRAERAKGEWGAEPLGPGFDAEEGGVEARWAPASLWLEVGDGDTKEDVGSPFWGAERL